MTTDPWAKALARDPRQAKVDEWLKLHDKGDFHECSWEEIGQALAYAGFDSPLVAYAKRAKEQGGMVDAQAI